jgi:hypothetical protein
MPSKPPLLFQIGTFALAFCAILSAQIGMRPKLPNPRTHKGPSCTNCVRDLSGTIAQNPAPVRAFRSKHPCPATGSVHGACPGYVVDIASGKMRWRTMAQAAKDGVK